MNLVSQAGVFSARIEGQPPRYSVDVPHGTYDLAALDAGANVRVVLRRDLTIDAEGVSDIDFAGALTLGKRNAIVKGSAAGDSVVGGVRLHTSRGTLLVVSAPLPAFYAFDENALLPGDTQELFVGTIIPRGEFNPTSGDERGVTRALPGTADVEVLLPAALGPTTVEAAAAAPVLRPRVTFTPFAGALFYQMSIIATMPAPSELSWTINASAGWLGAATSLELPDLSSVDGFLAGWGPSPAGPAIVSITAVSSTRGFGPTLDGEMPLPPGSVTTHSKRILSLPGKR